MFNKKLLTALLVIAGAASTQARVIAPAQISSLYTAETAAAPSSELTYSIHLSSDSQGLEAKMYEIAQSGGEWLSDEELLQYTRASDDNIEKVKDYLSKFGGKNFQLNKWGDQLSVTHSVKEANEAWKANLTHYKHAKQGYNLVRTPEYTVPDDLHDAIINVHPFTAFPNLERMIPIKEPAQKQKAELESRAAAGCNSQGITMECIRNQYGASSYTPKPQNGTLDAVVIGILGQYVSESDLTKFLQQQRPDQSNYKIDIKTAAGGTNDQSKPGMESMLDVEMVSGIVSPLNAQFLSYGPASGQITLNELFQYILDSGSRPGVVSLSYGADEGGASEGDAQALCGIVQKLAAQGTTIVVSSGDNGVNGVQVTEFKSCRKGFNPTFPSGCPYLISAGATDLHPVSNLEEVVDGFNLLAGGFWSGAGFSNLYPVPEYQKADTAKYIQYLGNLDKGKFNTSGRAYPDFSVFGAQIKTVNNGIENMVSGTSASAPIIAGHIALLNNYRQTHGKSRVGWFNPTIYAHPEAFTDLTTGRTGGCFDSLIEYFHATTGWDAASGLGTPKFDKWLALP